MGTRSKQGQRLGLVEVEIGGGWVYLTFYPPGKQSATVELSPDDARGLAAGIADGADQAERPEGASDAAAAGA